MDTQPIALPTPRTSKHPALIIATVAYTALIGWITLSSAQSGSALRSTSRWVLHLLERLPVDISSQRWEFLLNLGLFVPLGALLVLLFGARFFWVAALAALALTFSIEALQHFIPYRVLDPRDLMANGLGGVVGTLLGVGLLSDVSTPARN